MRKIRKSGLPSSVEMRHDDHFVELIASKTQAPQLRVLPLSKIDPNPQQPRSELGDIDELMASIREKGILEPILVRGKNGRYEIIAGERRFLAAKRIGLEQVPCIEMKVKDNEAMEISLIENLQRRDLNVFEEADGLKALAEIYGYNHEQIARKIGKARSTITEILTIGKIPHEVRNLCSEVKISSRSTLIEIAKQKTRENMLELVTSIKERSLRREDTRELARRIKGSPVESRKRYVFSFRPRSVEKCKLQIVFNKQRVDKEEVIRILEEVLENLKKKS